MSLVHILSSLLYFANQVSLDFVKEEEDQFLILNTNMHLYIILFISVSTLPQNKCYTMLF